MSVPQKRGALLFFGKGRLRTMSRGRRQSNEMFSDFKKHVIGVPQIAPISASAKASHL